MVPPLPTSTSIGHLIRTYRETTHLTQQQLADTVGCTKGLISQIERGTTQVTLLRAAAIAQALGVALVHLLQYPACPTCGHTIGVVPESGQLQALRATTHQHYEASRQRFEAAQAEHQQRLERFR